MATINSRPQLPVTAASGVAARPADRLPNQDHPTTREAGHAKVARCVTAEYNVPTSISVNEIFFL